MNSAHRKYAKVIVRRASKASVSSADLERHKKQLAESLPSWNAEAGPKGLPESTGNVNYTDPHDPLKDINPASLWTRGDMVTGSGSGPALEDL